MPIPPDCSSSASTARGEGLLARDRADASPSIFLVAGEPSGDEIGGRLIAALREAAGDRIGLAGVGGEAMAAQGFESLFPMEELSVMGLVEVLPRAIGIMRRMSETAAAIRRLSPDAVVTIDAPEFANGVWRRLGGTDTALIHYVAPTVGARDAGERGLDATLIVSSGRGWAAPAGRRLVRTRRPRAADRARVPTVGGSHANLGEAGTPLLDL